MLSDELRRRLAHRSASDHTGRKPDEDDSPFRERLRRAARAYELRDANIPAARELQEAVSGREVETESGRFYLVEPEPETLHKDMAGITAGHVGLRYWSSDSEDTVPSEYRSFIGPEPERILYLDIETTGFMGTPLFLIGIMYLERGSIRISQLLARDYSEEGPLLEYLAEKFSGFDCLITFNGKSFDIPFIRDRYFANAIRCRFPQHHLDLLWPSRRKWRAKLPDCTLQTLEKWICGRGRVVDIPGMEIPDTYHLFVRTGNAALLCPILEHNALDLVTMGDLIFHLFSD